jgi:activating signal cointegrator complex subunit 1
MLQFSHCRWCVASQSGFSFLRTIIQGHHPELRKQILEFHMKLLPLADATAADKAIEGLDRSILVDPRRLHFTIGVMTLSADEGPKDGSGTSKGKTVSDAIALLRSLGPEINEITRQPLHLSLDKMGVLKTTRQQAGVLYVGPGDEMNEETIKVGRIFGKCPLVLVLNT